MKPRTLLHEGGAHTTFDPPRASMERIKVKDERGRTMFDRYEPRYFAEEPRRSTPAPARASLVARVQRRPLPVIAALFACVLVLSAALTVLIAMR